MHHHAEDGHRGQQVGEEVEEDGTDRHRLVERGHHAEQQVAGVRHAGQAHEAFDVVLRECGEIAEEDRGGGDQREDRGDERLVGAEDGVRQQEEQREAGGLGGDGEKRGHGRGRTLIDIGHPDLEGHRADLEGHAAEHERDADGGEQVVGIEREELRERREAKRIAGVADQCRVARRAVQQRDAEEQDRRAEPAGDQVFQAGFLRERAGAEVAHEDVESDGDRLQRHEEQHEMVGLHEQHKRRRDHEHDVEKLHARQLLLRERDRAQEADEQRGEHEEQTHELAGGGVVQQAVEGVDAEAGLEPYEQAGEDADLRGHRDDRDEIVVLLGQQHLQGEQREREHAEHQLGHDGHPEIVGGGVLEVG